MADPTHVREQYATEDNLETRRSVWQPDPVLGDPVEVALEAVSAALPGGKSMPDVLEVGSGPGVFAARLQERLPHIALLATDQSPRFVELARERGVPAQLMDVQHLLPGDDSYDVVVAMWMLYHVPDLHRGLAEIRRVLRPGGTFVAVTNGDEHVAGLRRDAGGAGLVTHFSSQIGEAALREHFDTVERVDLRPSALFADHAAAQAYLDSSDEGLVIPHFEGSREYAGEVTVFTAR
ncbi:class I SAM-dependent methyltransferase [Nocardioides bigeumensis]|uniref:Methyltransferase type 11 domain-containing protein n=1 Tax=Nocardioides bigeumensis TaxID=433657 RepID=A0ABN2YN86_9ACTN